MLDCFAEEVTISWILLAVFMIQWALLTCSFVWKLACVITYDLRELMFRYMFRFYMAVSIFFLLFFNNQIKVSIRVSEYNWSCMAFFGGTSVSPFFCFVKKKRGDSYVSVAYGSFIWWRWARWDAGDDLWFSKLHLQETQCSNIYWRLEMSYYGSRMALHNFPATIGCGRVLIDLPQEDFVVV